MLVCEVKLAHKPRVSLAKDGVTVAWYDFARLQSDVDVFSDVCTCPVLTVLSFEGEKVV